MFFKQHEISMSCELSMRAKFVVPLDQKVARKPYDHFGTPFVSLSLPKLELYSLEWPYPLTRKYGYLTQISTVHSEMRYFFNIVTCILGFLVWEIQWKHWKEDRAIV